MNFDPVWQGVIAGLSLAFLMGPSFFTLIQTSIYRGFKAGIILATGILCSDATLVLVCYLGLSKIINNAKNDVWVGIIGGIVLIIFGIITFYRKPHIEYKDCDGAAVPIKIKTPRNLTYFLKGYVLNIANPFLLLFWMSILLIVQSNYNNDKSDILLFFSTMLAMSFMLDTIKSFIANKIKKYLNPPKMLWINRTIGIVLLIFGCVLIIRVFYQL